MIPGSGRVVPRPSGIPTMNVWQEETPRSRRELLRWGLAAGGAWLLDSLAAPLPSLAAQGAGGYELLDVLPFADEGRNFVGQMAGEGRDGRRALDLTRLTSKNLVTPTDRFFVRTRHPEDLGSVDEWRVRFEGLVEKPTSFGLADLEAMAVPLGAQLLECAGSTRNSGFGLMGAADWHGVPLARLFEAVPRRPQAARVLVSGRDPATGPFPGGNWIFTFGDLTAAGAALATRMNGEPLTAVHGRPVRLVVPRWYGCCWVKWVDKIVYVADAAEATSQMREFAGRTHQRGIPRLAREYAPATIDAAALPVRLEKWRGPEGLFYRVVGVAWGGPGEPAAPVVRFEPGDRFEPVERYAPPKTATWGLWSHLWRPRRTGRHAIELDFADPTLTTRRMDSGYYLRAVHIPEIG